MFNTWNILNLLVLIDFECVIAIIGFVFPILKNCLYTIIRLKVQHITTHSELFAVPFSFSKKVCQTDIFAHECFSTHIFVGIKFEVMWKNSWCWISVCDTHFSSLSILSAWNFWFSFRILKYDSKTVFTTSASVSHWIFWHMLELQCLKICPN